MTWFHLVHGTGFEAKCEDGYNLLGSLEQDPEYLALEHDLHGYPGFVLSGTVDADASRLTVFIGKAMLDAQHGYRGFSAVGTLATEEERAKVSDFATRLRAILGRFTSLTFVESDGVIFSQFD